MFDRKRNTVTSPENIAGKDNSYNRSLSWWNLVRWLSTISFFAVCILSIIIQGGNFPRESFIMILVALNLLNLVYSFWLTDIQSIKFFPILHNLLDVIVFSIAISITGGVKSPLIWSYLIPIITSSITIGKKTGFFACIFSFIGLIVVITYTQGIDIKQIIILSPLMRQELLNQLPNILSYTCLFLLTYFISSFLSEALRKQNRVLILLNNLLDKRNRDIVRAQDKVQKMEELESANRLAQSFRNQLINPLTIIAMNTELLLKENFRDNSTSERIKAVNDGVMRMKTVLGKIEQLYQANYR